MFVGEPTAEYVHLTDGEQLSKLDASKKSHKVYKVAARRMGKKVKNEFTQFGKFILERKKQHNPKVESLDFKLPTEKHLLSKDNKTPEEQSRYAFWALTELAAFLDPSSTERLLNDIRSKLTIETMTTFMEAEVERFKEKVNLKKIIDFYWVYVVHRHNLSEDPYDLGNKIDPESKDLTKEPGGYCLIGDFDQLTKELLASDDQNMFLTVLGLRTLRSQVVYRNLGMTSRKDWMPDKTVKALYNPEEIKKGGQYLSILIFKGDFVKKIFFPIDLVLDEQDRKINNQEVTGWINHIYQEISLPYGWKRHSISNDEVDNSYRQSITFSKARKMRANPNNLHAADLSIVVDYGDKAGQIDLPQMQNDTRNFIGLATPLSLRVGLDRNGNVSSLGGKYCHQYIDGAQANEELTRIAHDTVRKISESKKDRNSKPQKIFDGVKEQSANKILRLKERFREAFIGKETKREQVLETTINTHEHRFFKPSIKDQIKKNYDQKEFLCESIYSFLLGLVDTSEPALVNLEPAIIEGLRASDIKKRLSFDQLVKLVIYQSQSLEGDARRERKEIIRQLINANEVLSEIKPDLKNILQLAYLMTFNLEHCHTLTINSEQLLNPVVMPFPIRLHEQIRALDDKSPIPNQLIADVYQIFKLMKNGKDLVPTMGVMARGGKRQLEKLGQAVEGDKGLVVTDSSMCSTLVQKDGYKTVYEKKHQKEDGVHFSLKKFSTAFNEIYRWKVMAACDIDDGNAVYVSVRCRGQLDEDLSKFEEEFRKNFEILLDFFTKMIGGIQTLIEKTTAQNLGHYAA